ncbi:MAG: 6-phospho-3-hexuloisomerase, partial [Mesorhizobium sp.]
MSDKSKSLFETALEELGGVLARIDESRIDAACKMLAGARQIVVYGCGREALQVKGFAMRLYHLGLPVSVVGDMNTPPLGQGDVFLVSSGPGETSTVLTLMQVAHDAG